MKRTGIILIIFMMPLLTGCFSVSSYFRDVRSDIIKQVDGEFILDTEFAIGPTLISLAGMFISSEDDPEAKAILRDISNVEIGVYKRVDASGGSNYRVLQSIDKRMKKHGWRYIVRSCSKDEVSAIYVNRDIDQGINRMFIVSLDNNELAMIQLKGDINHAIETAVHDRGLNYYSVR
jgi:hypothetical protein